MQKLKQWDTIRVIAPSRSMAVISNDIICEAKKTLVNTLWLNVTFAKNVMSNYYNNSWSIKDRVEDIHEAFLDPNIKWILTVLWGYSSNNLLDYLDYDLIKDNPKIICWYSDITALSNAIRKKTWLVTYSGPHFSTFAMKKGNEYTIDHFKKALFQEEGYELKASEFRSNDERYIDQEKRNFSKNNGLVCIQQWTAEGVLIGWNLNTLNLLQWTNYLPKEDKTILFLEEVGFSADFEEFDRNLESLLQAYKEIEVTGLIIGRFSQKILDLSIFKNILLSKKKLRGIPIIYNVNFWHTFPITTMPIWWLAKIQSSYENSSILITNH